MIERVCKTCKKVFYTYPSRISGKNSHTADFCSKYCYSVIRNKNLIKYGKNTRFNKGHISFSKEHPEMMPRGESHCFWKGNKVGYRGLHYWLKRTKGIPNKCEFCGKQRTTIKSIHWANVDRKYKRDTKSYIALCASCHKLYDLKSKPPSISRL